jgi:phage terminase large subunit-like protein
MSNSPNSRTEQELELLKKELELLKWEEKDRELNPHLYVDLYDWQDEFINCTHHRQYLTCANQVGKTFSLMLKGHKWCTDKEFRIRQWGNNQPRVFWYVLPTQEHINDFFNDKWEPEILSRGDAKKKGPYSWKVIKKGMDVKGIKFLDTMCTLNFITLAAKSSSHQGRSVGGILFDEEPPVDKLAELETRTASFNDPETGLSTAILAFAFTPTSAQDYFKQIFSFQDEKFLKHIPRDLKDKYFLDKETDSYRTCSIREQENELFKSSDTVWKRRVSMFEACTFKSGKPGRYTKGRIREFINGQPTKRDVLVRAFAQFEKEDDGGLIYKYFNRDVHLKKVPRHIIKTYAGRGLITAGLDYGSGSNHPGGVVLTWISDDRKKVRILKMWRGEKGKVTTAGDIVDKYIEMSRGFDVDFPFYDHSAPDLNTIYNRMTGKELYKADKNVVKGVGLIDTLFKNNLLQIYYHDDEPYGDWVAQEYENLSNNVKKHGRLDELTDCIKYSLSGIAHMFQLEGLMPVDASELLKKEIKKEEKPEDYGVRSWENVPEKNKKDDWIMDELEDWEGLFND